VLVELNAISIRNSGWGAHSGFLRSCLYKHPALHAMPALTTPTSGGAGVVTSSVYHPHAVRPGHPSRLPRSRLSQGHAHAAHQPRPDLSYASYHHSRSMNQSPASNSTFPATASSCNFKVIFEKALRAYKNTTQQDRTVSPLFNQLQACDSPAAIRTILQDQVNQFIRSRSGDERLKKWLDPTINVLYAFSGTLGEGVGLVNVNSSVEGITLMPTR
jgi:hypothetical protein